MVRPVRFHLCNIFEMRNSRNGEQISGCQGLGGGCDYKRDLVVMGMFGV